MNAEQKQRAIKLITYWRNRSITTMPEEYFVSGDCMTDLLQELVDAHEPKPVARVTGYYAGYLSIATVDGRVLPAGTALYAAPPHQSEHHLEMVNTPAPSVPDGWKRAIDEALVVHHIDIADSSDGYEEAKKKLNELLAINSDIARYCSEPPDDVARDAALYCAVQRSCAELPEGWEIRIELERSAGTVILVNPDGEDVDYPSDHEYMASDINDAIDAAIAAEKG